MTQIDDKTALIVIDLQRGGPFIQTGAISLRAD